MDAASDHEVEESKEVAAHTNEPHAPTEEPVQEGGAKGKRLTFGAGLLVKRPSRIEVFKKLMSTEVLRSTVRKHITTNRLLDASTKMKNEGTNVRSDSFTARLFCQENGEEHIVAWKRTGSFVRLKELVCNMFQFEDCDLFDVERHLRLNSDSEISLMVDEWSEREAARKQDILATWLLEVQQQLTDQEPDLALHALWELACRPENHSDVSVDLIEQVVSTMLDCTHEKKHHRIAAMAAAALWMLAEPETTRNTFPLEMCVPALIQTATKIFECKEHSDLTLHPIGALGCLLRVPEAVPLFDQAGGTAMLMPTLTSQSAQVRSTPRSCAERRRCPSNRSQAWQVRRVATATLYFVTTLSENACLTIASTGGLPKLAEVSLNKGESTALRASALLALGCCVKRTAEVLTASDEADGAARLGQGFKLPPQLLEHLTTFGSALMNSIDATSDTGVAHNEPIGDRDSLDVLLGVVLNTMWNVLVLLYTSPLPPEMVPRRDALTGAAAFLKRVLESNLNYLCICPACGALNNIPKYVASSNVSIALLQKLPFIHGRTLEAGATLLAQVVQKKSECDLFMQAGGADAVLVRMVRLIEESRAAENAADDEMHSLQGSAMRAHAALSFALMTAVCAAARVIVFDPSMEDGELPPLPRDEGNAEHPRRSRRRRSVLAAPDQTQPKAQKVGGSSGVPVREDHHRIAEWFVKLDENNDGFVTREELISVVLEHGGTKEQAMSICEELDGNNDGTISLFELCDAYGVRMPLLRAGSFELLVNASAVAQTRSLCYLMVGMWTLATFSNCRAPLGKAQGVEAALRALKRAMNEHEQEPVGSQGSATRLWCLKAAQWACAALWLLCYDDDNAIRLLELSVDLIVHLARNGEPTLRFMAMGCVVRLVLLPTTMNTMIMDYKATELLRKVGHDRNASDRLRLMCTTTLGFLTRSDGSIDASISEQVTSPRALAVCHAISTIFIEYAISAIFM
ncbi:hypothetical protein AB1Y20_001154 [Prymnesium parvum]|uniref:EF-hand domain-containing protein n=1 Tax=Prymnesium parvum TaxID=97485 RepID=A0AB34K8P8_PRYPA